MKNQPRHVIRLGLFGLAVLTLLALFWFGASAQEWRTGKRAWPWSAYALCGNSKPAALPSTVRIGLYEEFPVPWRSPAGLLGRKMGTGLLSKVRHGLS